jgi:cytosol alanyl aminopeptidase
VKRLGWKPSESEPQDVRQLRPQAIGALAGLGRDPATRAEATKLARAYLGDGPGGDGKLHPEAVPEELVSTVMGIAGEDGDARLWDVIRARLDTTEVAQQRGALLSALASATKPELVEKTLALLLDPALRKQERGILAGMLTEEKTQEQAWQWLRKNVDAYVPLVPDQHLSGVILRAGSFCDEAGAKTYLEFVSGRAQQLHVTKRQLDQAAERMRLCIALKEGQQASAQEFFRGRLQAARRR